MTFAGFGQSGVHTESIGDGPAGERDVDLYLLSFPPDLPLPILLTVYVRAPTFGGVDGYLRLFDASGLELANDDDSALGTTNPQIRTYLLDAGTYYIGVSGAGSPYYDVDEVGSGRDGSTGTYSLLVTLSRASFPPPMGEPNSFSEPHPVVPIEGVVEINDAFIGDDSFKRRDVDAYRFAVAGPSRIDVEVRARAMESTLDATVEVHYLTLDYWTPMTALDDRPDRNRDPKLSALVPAATSVLVVVSGAGNRDHSYPLQPKNSDSGIGSVGPYDLIVTITPLETGGENEPNDSIMTATHTGRIKSSGENFPITTTAFHGAVGDGPFAMTRGDRDFYEVFAEPGGLLHVDVKPDEGSELQPVVIAYDLAGHQLGKVIAAQGGENVDLKLAIRCIGGNPNYVDPTAPVYIMVIGAGQRPPNDPAVPLNNEPSEGELGRETYVVGGATGSTGGYEITFRVRAGICGEEPNDILEDASLADLDNQGTFVCTEGVLGDGQCAVASRDVDVWRFSVTDPPVVLDAVLDSRECRYASERIGLSLFDAGGQLLASIADTNDGTIGLTQLEREINNGGDFYLAVSFEDNGAFDLSIPCSGTTEGSDSVEYDLFVSLSPSRPAALLLDSPLPGGDEPLPLLFATTLDGTLGRILAFNRSSGQVVRELPAPEAIVSGAEGLAYDGLSLFYLGLGRYPTLYQLDSASGAIAESTVLSAGSGYLSDMVLLGNRLYVLDQFEHSLHTIDTATGDPIGTLDIGRLIHVTIGGGLAAVNSPARLYVGDAFATGQVHEIDPTSGQIVQSFPKTPLRPTAMASIGDGQHLLVADWLDLTGNVLGLDGKMEGTLDLPAPIGSLGGKAFVGPIQDCNGNGVADETDLADGTSRDCNENGLPDDCDVLDSKRPDCNGNKVPDECERDCDGDHVPDVCELSSCVGDPVCGDCNANEIPDGCEMDCDGNGVPDECDIASGVLIDSDGNSRPDECETTLYVDRNAPGGGDGSSWERAYTDLQSALGAGGTRANQSVEIRVADGTYTPAGPGGDRHATFRMSRGLALRGGYAGYGAPDPDQRRIDEFVTVLSGDLDQDDTPAGENTAENSFHVVTIRGGDGLIEGLQITAARADGAGWQDRFGAAIFNDGGNLTLRECQVHRCTAGRGSGETTLGGGGMYNRRASAHAWRCSFRNNLQTRDRRSIGGAMLNQDSRVTVDRCILQSNGAGPGGGIYNSFSDLTVMRTAFVSNRVGALNHIFGNLYVSDTVFTGDSGGAGVNIEGGRVRFERCTFGNGPGLGEGARAIQTGRSTGLASYGSNVEIVGSILWNGGNEIRNLDGSTITVWYTDITHSWSGPGGNNYDVDPMFVDADGADGIAGNEDDNLRLAPGSPMIDAGDPNTNVLLDATDLDGHARILCAAVDLGAYETGAGDVDCDQQVDLADFQDWPACVTGPAGASFPAACPALDIEFNGAVDLRDFAAFQRLFGGK